MKKIIIIILLIFVLAEAKASDWTFFVYMAADNGLYQHARDDIIEMQKGLQITSTAPNIIVFIDHALNYKEGVVEYLQIKPSINNYVD